MDKQTLKKHLSDKLLENADLTGLDIDGTDFSGCTIRNVTFSRNSKPRELNKLDFRGAELEYVYFDSATLNNCHFDRTKKLNLLSFRYCTIKFCWFRSSDLSWVDFAYSDIIMSSFEGSIINFCDFHRVRFGEDVIFWSSTISNSKFTMAYFNIGPTLRKGNIANGKIVQEDMNAYREFLKGMTKLLNKKFSNNRSLISDHFYEPKNTNLIRYREAEEFYKTMNGLWSSMGFHSEANWAYVKGKRMERKKLIAESWMSHTPFKTRIKNITDIVFNYITDVLFGYGESMTKILLTYISIIIIFAWIYYSSGDVSLTSYFEAIGISFNNMLAMSSDKLSNTTPFIDFLNLLQTGLGILITGIFGFILGNKIRNQ